MQHTEALALKYRPLDFDELVGQEAVSKTLSLALDSKRLSHAYLFSGLRGSGKTSSARIFARALQCDEGPRAKPCGVCANCIAANPHKMRHLDIIELDGASNRRIDDIRDLIEQTKYHPTMGRYKIFIIDEVHMLVREAFNALLKTLEEPPEYVKFILATTDPLKIPPTILSRTQHFRFKKISPKSIEHHLSEILQKEQIAFESEALGLLIRHGSGSLRDTLTLLDQAILYCDGNVSAHLCANMLGVIASSKLAYLFEAILNEDQSQIFALIDEFLEYDSQVLLDEMALYLKNTLFESQSKLSPLLIDRFFRVIMQAKQLLLLGAHDDFVLTLMAFKMLESLKIKKIDELIASKLTSTPTQSIPPQSNPQSALSMPKKESAFVPEVDFGHRFGLLVEKIYARNYELGQCFEQNITFQSFQNDILTWQSQASGADKERLIRAYSIIKHLAMEVFGTKIQIRSIPNPSLAQISSQTPNSTKAPISQAPLEPKLQQAKELAQTQPALNASKEILESAFIQKAKEVLNIQKIIIKAKQ